MIHQNEKRLHAGPARRVSVSRIKNKTAEVIKPCPPLFESVYYVHIVLVLSGYYLIYYHNHLEPLNRAGRRVNKFHYRPISSLPSYRD